MPKKDLIGGALWEAYSKKVAARMDNPANRGELTEADARRLGGRLIIADHGAESCGDAVRLYWVVDPDTHVIKAARFKSFGCGTAIASSDMMAELCMGRTVDQASKITNIDVERALRDEPTTPAVPPQKMHCSVMAYDVIKKAVALYKGVDLSSLETETIVCECGRVSLGTIVDAIRLNDLKTVSDITHYTKAGGFCKSCVEPGGHEKRQHYLVDILRDTRAQMEKEQLQMRMETQDFASMTLVRKLKAVEKALNENVRQMLAADGGDVELVDLKESSGVLEVYIQYRGACLGCPSAGTNTLSAIETVLRQKVAPNIRVIPS
ncbi:MAG TPA: iron-sulfur cluster assembly scaffold protein NifU [Elusimicrobia bacterium]|nr:iron-sulfur cluster assembly scaffold protein NifU [Elusimicrobiota bacterium]HBT62698.1 iron-sulfur cluster assembly scaffold protein NifU [Elusimicrobiota bacterium]